MLEIVNDFVMPATVKVNGAKGSKYFPTTLQETMEAMGLNQGTVWTLPADVNGKKAMQWTKSLSKEHFKAQNKTFAYGLTEDGTAMLIKCIGVQVAAAEPAAEGTVEKPAEQPAKEPKVEAPAAETKPEKPAKEAKK